MKKRIGIFVMFAVIILLFSGCAQLEVIDECVVGKVYGFWSGLWHGMIIFFSFIGSLFSDNIVVYAVNNTGGWYDFGFLLGVGAFSGGTYTSTTK